MLRLSQLFMFGNGTLPCRERSLPRPCFLTFCNTDWADDHNRGLLGNEIQGVGSTNAEDGWAISDHSNTVLQRNV